MSALAKQPASDLTTVPASDVSSVLSLISRAATDPNVDIDKMERLLQMHERMSAKQAEQAFNDALTSAQAQMPRVGTNKRNSQTGSNYADLEALDRIVRPIYTAHGFSLSYDTEPSDKDSELIVVCYCAHRAGFTRRYTIAMPADGKGAKGNDVMTKTHATGSAMSYGKRYLLQGIFNIVIGLPDDDGNAAAGSYDCSTWYEAINGCIDLVGLNKVAADIKAAQGIPPRALASIKAAWSARATNLKGAGDEG